MTDRDEPFVRAVWGGSRSEPDPETFAEAMTRAGLRPDILPENRPVRLPPDVSPAIASANADSRDSAELRKVPTGDPEPEVAAGTEPDPEWEGLQ